MVKLYTLDSVTAASTPDGVARQMGELTDQGWKNLQYVAHNSWGDCHAPEIMGNRPMTTQEIKEHEKNMKQNEKEDLGHLNKLAKKYGFKLTKVTKPKKPKKKHGWKWSCSAQNPNFGRWHADAEWCSAESKKFHETKEQAQLAGDKHAAKCYMSQRHGKSISVYHE